MNQINASPTLDVLFQRILARRPNALALIDPPNKQRITGQAPQQLTYAEADRVIEALTYPGSGAAMRARARKMAIERYSLDRVCFPKQVRIWERLVGRSLQPKRRAAGAETRRKIKT